MPIGGPDYGIYSVRRGSSPSFDLSELAARLGALSTITRTGETLWQSDFSEGLSGKGLSFSGAGSMALLNRERFLSGNYSICFVAGSSPGCTILKVYAPFELEGSYGVELWGACPLLTGRLNLWFREYVDSTHSRLFEVSMDFDAPYLKVYDGALGWVLLSDDPALVPSIYPWYQYKLVVNHDTGHYVRLSWQGTEYDLSDYIYVAGGGIDEGCSYIEIEVIGPLEGLTAFYLDRLILTVNEPVF